MTAFRSRSNPPRGRYPTRRAPSLEAQQTCFHIKSSREARKFSGRPDDAMARHDDGYRIFSVRGADRSCCPGIPQLFRQASVASGLSKRYGKQRFPYVLLKTSSSHLESDREPLSFSGEVLP